MDQVDLLENYEYWIRICEIIELCQQMIIIKYNYQCLKDLKHKDYY